MLALLPAIVCRSRQHCATVQMYIQAERYSFYNRYHTSTEEFISLAFMNIFEQSDGGLSLWDDIASIWKDPTYHDVTFICADGVELGACRAILASRCPFFKAMLYGKMLEGSTHRIDLPDITSVVLNVILGFIHTDDIDNTIEISTAVGVYCAANFLLLPKLMKMVLECAHDPTDFGVASSLLNEAISTIPWSEVNKDLYDVLLNFFRTRKLAIGELTDLSEDALELLLTKSTTFATPEHELLLCVVDWAWARSENTPSASERRAVLHNINDMVAGCDGMIQMGDDMSCALLLKMINHFDLKLVCPHRLKSLTKAVDTFAEASPQNMALYEHASRNTVCPTGHPSACRTEHPSACYTKARHNVSHQWDRSKIGSKVVVSEDGQVVELPSGASKQTVPLSVPWTKDHGDLCELDIVVESLGAYSICEIGLVGEEFTHFDGYMATQSYAWAFQSYGSGQYTIDQTKRRNYGTRIETGDVITFHLNQNDNTCALSINGFNHGIAWINLPNKVYPAVTLYQPCKYRIKEH